MDRIIRLIKRIGIVAISAVRFPKDFQKRYSMRVKALLSQLNSVFT